jgi:sugar lactone lactonase YvrE
MRAVIFVSVVMLVCGCGNPETPQSQSESDIDSLTLAVSDTIGVLFGDSIREFGSLADVEFDHFGNILALDAMKGRITIFDPSLEFAGFIGRHGSGPGEYQYPNSFGQTTDGRILVADFSGSSLTILDQDHNYIDRLDGFPLVPPMNPEAGPDGSYYAGNMSIDLSIEGGLPTGTSFIGLYSGGMEPDLVCVSFPLSINIGDDGDVNVDNVDVVWDSDSRGNLFWAVSDDSTYTFHGMTPDGEEFLSFEKEWERVSKTDEELEEERYSEGLSRSDQGEATVNRGEIEDVYPYHNAIDGLYIDDEDRVWIELGYTTVPSFDVYSSSGEQLSSVTIPSLEGVKQLRYSFKGGMLAFDYGPPDYPKIYLLSLQD